MSPDSKAMVRLAAEIRRDLAAAQERIDALAARRGALEQGDPVLLAFFAFSLHAHYTAIETACERIARVFDGGVPAGERSHQELLEAMALDLPGVRPAVLGVATVDGLRELLAFRHFVRHAYAVNLRAARLAELTDLASVAQACVSSDMDRFQSFLDALASA